MQRNRIIAIDFDGTIFDGKKRKMIDGACDGIRRLRDRGYILVLWTCRSGKRLQNAINILKANGVYDCFECVNATPSFVRYKVSCKVCAYAYIDDRNIGGFIGWDKVLEILGG